MNFGMIKRVICSVLCILMVAMLPVSVLAQTAEVTPIIYIGQMTENRLYSNPGTTKAKPAFLPDDTVLYSSVLQIIAGIGASMLSMTDWGINSASTGFKTLLEPIACENNGTSATQSIGVMTYDRPLSFYTEDESVCTPVIAAIGEAAAEKVGYDNIFIFSYDWRLDPIENGQKLSAFIDHVKSYTGHSRVSLIAGGYGGIIANCYLYANMSHAEKSVASCVFLNSEVFGNSIAGNVMRGNLSETVADGESIIESIRAITGEERSEAFVRYVNDDPYGMFVSIFETILGEGKYVNALSSAVVFLVNYILNEENLYTKFGAAYNAFVFSGASAIYDNVLREYLRNMPGIWALVPPDDFDSAMEFMFGNEPVPSAALEEKINAYRTVMNAAEDTFNTALEKGINVAAVANYNLQIIPVTGTIDEECDCIQSTQLASFGATTRDVDVHWEGESNCNDSSHDHVSPDLLIDASTCILPENTWFIKNLTHMDFTTDSAADFIIWLAVSNGKQRTVHDSRLYPQFLSYSKVEERVFAYVYGKNNDGYPFGDCNCDNEVNAEDARLALRYAVGLEHLSAQGMINADVDFDDEIKSEDARIILRIAVKLQTVTDEDQREAELKKAAEEAA